MLSYSRNFWKKYTLRNTNKSKLTLENMKTIAKVSLCQFCILYQHTIVCWQVIYTHIYITNQLANEKRQRKQHQGH